MDLNCEKKIGKKKTISYSVRKHEGKKEYYFNLVVKVLNKFLNASRIELRKISVIINGT